MCLFLRRLLRCGLLVRRRCSSRLHFSRLSRSRLLHLRRPFLQLGCLELLPIKSDLDNPHRGKVLPMPAQLLILLLAFVMEDQDLFLAALLHDFTGHLRARLGHANLARLGRDRQHVAEFDLAVGAGALAFDPNYIARRHPVLLATGADDRVHTYASVKNVPSHQVQGMESAGFPCLLLSASALLANVADGPRTEPQVQANSTILACCVGKGQTRGSSWSTKAIDSRKLSLKSNRLSGKGQLQTPLSAALLPKAYGEGDSILLPLQQARSCPPDSQQHSSARRICRQ